MKGDEGKEGKKKGRKEGRKADQRKNNYFKKEGKDFTYENLEMKKKNRKYENFFI